MFGAILGAAGDIFGGITARNQAKRELAESKRQFNVQDDYNKNLTQYRVKDALAAGINPLAALGQSANYSPTISAGGSDGGASHFSRVGDRLQNMVQRLTARDAADDVRYKKEARELDLESKRIENRIAGQQLKILSQDAAHNEVPPVVQPNGDRLLFYPTYDLQGRPRLLVNQDATENDNDNAGYRSAILSGFLNGQIDKVSGRIKSNQLRMLIDDQYYRSTGHHISNLEDLYISPTELGISGAEMAGDAVKGIRGFFK